MEAAEAALKALETSLSTALKAKGITSGDVESKSISVSNAGLPATGADELGSRPQWEKEHPAPEANIGADGAKLVQSERPGGRKRKVALFMGYYGAGYHGMQFNPGVDTIEGVLEKAIVKAGGISAENAGKPRHVHWMRAARTDKGVSAIGQVVSLRMMLMPDGVIERINDALPDQIRCFGYRRTTTGFDARKQCDRRRYEYSLPEWIFDPDLFPTKGSWRPKSSLNTAALMDPSETETPSLIINPSKASQSPLRLREGYSLDAPPSKSSFVFDDECCDRMNAILSQYEETHNFHNFTPAVQATQMAAKRFILSFKCHGVFTIGEGADAVRWVRTEVIGQSFLLNQIRKMIGLALAIYRGTAPWEAMQMGLDPNRDFTTPMAPELGLHLCEAYYESYNRMFGRDREVLQLEDWADEVHQFKLKWVYPRLLERDAKESVNYGFMTQLTDQRYMFSRWKNANPVRNELRPKTRAAKEEENARKRARHEAMDALVSTGLTRKEANDQLMQDSLDTEGNTAKRAKLEDAAKEPEKLQEAGTNDSAQGTTPVVESGAVVANGERVIEEEYVAPVLDEEGVGEGGLLGDDDCVPEENYEDEEEGKGGRGRGRGRGGGRRGGGRGRR